VTETDPVISVLSTVDRAVVPRAAFADGLLDRCLDELRAPAATRVRPRRLTVGLVVALALLVASAATATYLATRGAAPPGPKGPSELTVLMDGGNGVSGIAAVGTGGRLRTLWRCPERGIFCGDLTSIAWSPDGKRLAFTLDELGGTSGYIGLHIVNVATGADLHLPSLRVAGISRPQPPSFFPRFQRKAIEQLGCMLPNDVAWSPDGSRLAYACYSPSLRRSAIFTLRANGTRRTLVPTGPSQAHWPAWSPDGKRIAFATQSIAVVRSHHRVVGRSSVYVVGLDGTGRTLVAHDASAPAWSPDGRTIAYESACRGVRLVTLEGVDVTPGTAAGQPCATIGPRVGQAVPTWSPDGTALAIATPKGVYVTAADGTGTRRATSVSSLGIFGSGRPAWTPGTGDGRRLLGGPKGGL
jgi:dipeptidyl aminopeptidase/acylaminoacyl peptidase